MFKNTRELKASAFIAYTALFALPFTALISWFCEPGALLQISQRERFGRGDGVSGFCPFVRQCFMAKADCGKRGESDFSFCDDGNFLFGVGGIFAVRKCDNVANGCGDVVDPDRDKPDQPESFLYCVFAACPALQIINRGKFYGVHKKTLDICRLFR